MLDHNVFIIICDSQRAHIYQNVGSSLVPNLTFIGGFEQKNPRSHEQGTDKAGTSFSSASGVRSHVADNDYHAAQQHAFAKEIIKTVSVLKANNNIQKIIWVSSPKMLSFLRSEMPKNLKDITLAEHDKDLTKHPKEKIIEYLSR